jgi:hypothetical protein
MFINRSLAVLVIFALSTLVAAQKTESDEKERQQRRLNLIYEVLAEVANLKLAENRAVVYARAGSLVWSLDQKRAVSLYQDAISELMNAQELAEANTKIAPNQNELLTGTSTRLQVLNAIAQHDAAFALEVIVKTRPSLIVKAMAAGRQAKPSKISSANSNYFAQNEFNMEQSFVRMAAEQNPALAKKLIEDAVAKGPSNETLNLIKKLAQTDKSEAADLASQFVEKLLQEKMTVDGQPNYQGMQLMLTVVNDHISSQKSGDQTLKFDDSLIRQLADKLISYYEEQGSYDGGYLSYSIIPIAEKFQPGSVTTLKTIAKNIQCRGLCANYDPELQTLMNSSDTTAEQLIAIANKYPSYQRVSIYQTAANKFLSEGNMQKAREVLSDNLSDDALENALSSLDSQYSYKLMNDGQYDIAKQLIDAMPETARFGSLMNLANSAYGRDPEKNKNFALSVISEARDLVNEPPENSTDFSNLMQLITTLTSIEPGAAFQIFESLVPKMNELSNAAAVISGFQGNSNVRNDEFLLSQGYSFGFYGTDFSQLRTLSTKDFDRTQKLIEGFTRREIRIALELQLADGL